MQWIVQASRDLKANIWRETETSFPVSSLLRWKLEASAGSKQPQSVEAYPSLFDCYLFLSTN